MTNLFGSGVGACYASTSDAGPDERGERKDWRDWLEDASLDIRNAERLYRDDAAAERKLRRAAIESAIDELKNALALVEA